MISLDSRWIKGLIVLCLEFSLLSCTLCLRGIHVVIVLFVVVVVLSLKHLHELSEGRPAEFSYVTSLMFKI